ncbi:hypothetical protein B0J13DRAFT_636185 [Dactylonectria estremocensis]|uniref:Uncharacterized protein n=1 Tax=Dactylonectria estremocensis TaxID=1079267 RepID=A0A9P9EQF5_9HYPO|nr:hypothetical protein B0J13DRAFT_636185 [Dactylonectria estremocensis]
MADAAQGDVAREPGTRHAEACWSAQERSLSGVPYLNGLPVRRLAKKLVASRSVVLPGRAVPLRSGVPYLNGLPTKNHGKSTRTSALALNGEGYTRDEIFKIMGILPSQLTYLFRKAGEKEWVEGQLVLEAYVIDRPRSGRPLLLLGDISTLTIAIITKNNTMSEYSSHDIALQLGKPPLKPKTRIQPSRKRAAGTPAPSATTAASPTTAATTTFSTMTAAATAGGTAGPIKLSGRTVARFLKRQGYKLSTELEAHR